MVRFAVPLLLVAMVVSGCSSPPALDAPETMEIVTHCGIGFPTIPYEGQEWHIDDGDGNPPSGWDNPFDTITVGRLDGRVVAIGPDGSIRVLTAGPGSGGGCM